MSHPDEIKRRVFWLAFVAASVFTTLLYLLFIQATLELAAIPRTLKIAEQLAEANDPKLYRQICTILIKSSEEAEHGRIEMLRLLRNLFAFLVVGCGLIFLLSLRLLRNTQDDSQSTLSKPGFAARLTDYLISAKEGTIPLRQAFWGLLLPVTALFTVSTFALASHLASSKDLSAIVLVSNVYGIGLVAHLFALAVVWKCAPNTGKKIWMWGARAIVGAEVIRLGVASANLLPFISLMSRSLGLY